jgi:antitoxin component YwqK of YwqJK toxin-antitoxin module
MNKILISLLLIIASCQNIKTKRVITATYDDGKIRSVREYPNNRDTLTYKIFIFYKSGKILQLAEVKEGYYIGKKVMYFENQNIAQVDSFFLPQLGNDPNWNGQVTRFYENGKISQRYAVKNGRVNGVFENYNSSGIISKEYQEIDTLKNGIYNEYFNNGIKSYQAYYINGQKSGMEYYFNETGDTIEYGLIEDNQ